MRFLLIIFYIYKTNIHHDKLDTRLIYLFQNILKSKKIIAELKMLQTSTVSSAATAAAAASPPPPVDADAVAVTVAVAVASVAGKATAGVLDNAVASPAP